jgi:hypothetical protein
MGSGFALLAVLFPMPDEPFKPAELGVPSAAESLDLAGLDQLVFNVSIMQVPAVRRARHRRGFKCPAAKSMPARSSPGVHMCQEEADHLPAGVGTACIRIRATRAATEPGMACAMQNQR